MIIVVVFDSALGLVALMLLFVGCQFFFRSSCRVNRKVVELFIVGEFGFQQRIDFETSRMLVILEKCPKLFESI